MCLGPLGILKPAVSKYVTHSGMLVRRLTRPHVAVICVKVVGKRPTTVLVVGRGWSAKAVYNITIRQVRVDGRPACLGIYIP